jgi:hypothetical protein
MQKCLNWMNIDGIRMGGIELYQHMHPPMQTTGIAIRLRQSLDVKLSTRGSLNTRRLRS